MTKIIQLKKTKPKPKYKYAINEQVGMLPRNVTIGDVITHLHDNGISRDSFYRDREIEFGSDNSIPSDRLFIYAKVFDCHVADLLNHEIKAKSIRQKNLKIKTGLG